MSHPNYLTISACDIVTLISQKTYSEANPHHPSHRHEKRQRGQRKQTFKVVICAVEMKTGEI